MSNAHNPGAWKIIRGLNSTPDSNSPNEAMSHYGRTITDTKSKANTFINHYARVSKLHMTKEDRDLNCLLKKRFNILFVDNESCTSIKMSELLSAIQKMKRKEVAGPNDISPTFLKSLGPLALQELLSIFNALFHQSDCPRIWRAAIIIPLLKAGKLLNDVSSLRTISLTSCAVMLMLLERITVIWLYYTAKSNNLFSRFQAGFSKGRSCKDQILQIVQAIEDGFQQQPM